MGHLCSWLQKDLNGVPSYRCATVGQGVRAYETCLLLASRASHIRFALSETSHSHWVMGMVRPQIICSQKGLMISAVEYSKYIPYTRFVLTLILFGLEDS